MNRFLVSNKGMLISPTFLIFTGLSKTIFSGILICSSRYKNPRGFKVTFSYRGAKLQRHLRRGCQDANHSGQKMVILQPSVSHSSHSTQPMSTERKWRGEGRFMKMSSYTIHQKNNIHINAHLDQGLLLISPQNPVFDLAIYEEQVCLNFFPTLSST